MIGTDTRSVLYHAILHMPVLQSSDVCNGPHWLYWSGRFIQQNMCPRAIQQAADLKEIQRPATSIISSAAWHETKIFFFPFFFFSLLFFFPAKCQYCGSDKHPVRLAQSFYTALHHCATVRCQHGELCIHQ